MYIRKGFTLIELLVVIAIIAILAVVVILTLQPLALLQQGRDSNRVSDLDTLTHALLLYSDDQGGSSGYSLGNASSVYVSLPDATISGVTTSTCSSLGLPALPSGYSYQCSSPQDYKNVNGTGWIPINFTSMSTGSPLGSLPVDPTNTSSTGLYYTYYTSGTQYEVTSLFESQKYKTQYAQAPMDPDYPEVDAKGSSLAISPIFNPSGLVGWWPLNEGSGTTAYDQSGNGNNGTWNGSAIGTGGAYYSAGKVGSYAGDFDGTSTYVNLGTAISGNTGSETISAWVNIATPPTASSGQASVLFIGNGPSWGQSIIIVNATGTPYFQVGAVTTNPSVVGYGIPGSVATTGAWYLVTDVFNNSAKTVSLYVNGALQTSTSTGSTLRTSTTNSWIGNVAGGYAYYFNGLIDDVRLYNRALSAAEIQALYTAEH